MKKPRKKAASPTASAEYGGLIGGIAELLEAGRRAAARTVNVVMTATYWEIGRRIVEFEQGGAERASYGEELLKRRCGVVHPDRMVAVRPALAYSPVRWPKGAGRASRSR